MSKLDDMKEKLGDDLVQKIYETVGSASMCWQFPEKAGVFRSEKASEVALELCEYLCTRLIKYPFKKFPTSNTFLIIKDDLT